ARRRSALEGACGAKVPRSLSASLKQPVSKRVAHCDLHPEITHVVPAVVEDPVELGERAKVGRNFGAPVRIAKPLAHEALSHLGAPREPRRELDASVEGSVGVTGADDLAARV